MIDFGYELVRQVYEKIWNATMFQWSMNSIKIVAVTVFLLSLYSNLIASKFDWGTQKLPLDKNKLINSLFMVFIVMTYDKIIDFLDLLLGELDKWANNYNHIKHVFDKKMEEANVEDPTLLDQAKQVAIDAYTRITNPMTIVNDILFGLFWIIDNVIYGIFLIERFFAITVLKISAPIIFVLSIHKKFENLWKKWFLLYITFYFMIVPFLLVIYIGNEVYAVIRAKAESNLLVPDVVQNNIINVGLIVAVVIKYRLFKKTNDLIYKIFTE